MHILNVSTYLYLLLALSTGLIWLSLKYFFSSGSRKEKDNKLLLRQLLENFDLEIPEELREERDVIIKN